MFRNLWLRGPKYRETLITYDLKQATIFDRTNGTNRILWVRILELRRNLVQHCVLCCQLVELSFLGLDRTFSDAKYLAIF